MSSFFWYQINGGEEAWLEASSEHRLRVIAELHPAFTTILDAHSSPEEGWGREEYASMKFSGPLYFDWDAESIDETIPNFHLMLAKLGDLGVNLEAIRLYATGGRGFHAEVPAEIVMTKVPRSGITMLPYVYREIAYELQVETLDMRVYTARKGRQWRTPNVKRSNDLYKVPLTLAEAMTITPESYRELCSSPRAEPPRATPEVAVGLNAMFIKAQGKVDLAVKKGAKASVQDQQLLARFKGNFPETMQRIGRGEGVMPGVGFQKIAMQLAIAAAAMGKASDELVEMCEGLCKTHQSDSKRYGSPRKRKEELRRMWDYVDGNPCYSFSVGGIRSLLEPGASSDDLDLHDRTREGFVADDTEVELTEEELAELKTADRGQLAGLVIHKQGTYVRMSEGLKPLSTVALTRPTRLLSADDRMHVGFEVDVMVSGKRHSRSLVTLDIFKTRASMHQAFSAYGGTFMGTDIQAGAMMTALDMAAKKAGREVYCVHREGLDIVQNPLVTETIQRDVIWAGIDGVRCVNQEVNYRFKPKLSNDPAFKSDIHKCEPIADTPETRAWLHNVFKINSPLVVAQMFGWFVSCLHKQFYNEAYSQFPLLHPNGSAGCGKTLTTKLFARLWHNATTPLEYGCGVSLTPFMLKTACQGSCSIPLILDEYKPTELGPVKTDLLRQTFRLAYNQAMGAMGGISKGGANSTWRDVTNFNYSAPIVFMAEAQEVQTAIVQRSLPVSFTTSGKEGREDAFKAANDGIHFMPQIGAALLRFGINETVASRKAAVDPLIKDLRASLDQYVHDRQVYNLAIVLAGLDFLERVLEAVFGEEFKADIEVLRAAVYTNKAEVAAQVANESAKVLDDMSLMSRTESPDSEFAFRPSYEYLVGDGYVEILMREAFVKYFSWSKRKGFTPLFQTAEAFIAAMGKFDAVVDKHCTSSPLKATGASKVYRFNQSRLAAEGVEMFKS